MFSLQFTPTNEAARRTFSQLICARRMTAGVLDSHMAEIHQAQNVLAERLRGLIISLQDVGEDVSPVAQDCAFAQVEPAVESYEGRVCVRLPVADEATALRISLLLQDRFKAASLGRGEWRVDVASATGGWALSNTQRDYFAWRITLPLGRPGMGRFYSQQEIEDGLQDAVYGALLGQAAIGGNLSAPPYSGNLHLALENAQEVGVGSESHLTDLHHLRFNANVGGRGNLFLGVDLMAGSGLIAPAK